MNQIASPIADSSKKIVRLSPIIPEIAKYSGVPVYGTQTWVPGRYILGMISRSLRGKEFTEFIDYCQEYLAITEDEDKIDLVDDLWARFINKELKSWDSISNPSLKSIEPFDSQYLDFPTVETPDKLFVKHFPHLLKLKPKLTRRKWASLLESYLRLIMMLDVMWVCHYHEKLLELFILEDNILDINYLENIFSIPQLFKPDINRKQLIRLYTNKYARSSIVLNDIHEQLSHIKKLKDNPSLDNYILEYFVVIREAEGISNLRERLININREIDTIQK